MAEHASLKHLKEEFVSNLNGTSTLEIAIVVCSAPMAVLLRKAICSWFIGSAMLNYASAKLMLDFTILVLPVLGCFTVLAGHTHVVLISMAMIAVGLLAASDKVNLSMGSSKPRGTLSWEVLGNTAMSGKRPFITHFRAYVNIATAISILAVDFVIFPRRFCKAETYGSGLMDVGVGAFVISNAIVSPEARGKHSVHSGIGSSVASVWKAILSITPLLVLGIARFASVKAADYQEHVSEYGVHWNFFFTLAVVKVLSSVVLCVFSPNLSWLLCITIACGYQYLLTEIGWRNFVLEGWDGQGSRRDLIEANREGICSNLGYLAIYFAGVTLGKFLLRPRARVKDWLKALLVLVIADALFWILLHVTNTHVEPLSRRMANLGYVLWMMAYNLQLLGSFLLVDILCVLFQEMGLLLMPTRTRSQPSGEFCLMEAVNRNGLVYFLLANLSTGLVNFLMITILAPPVTGLVVVTLHMLVLSIVFGLLHIFNITLKFW